MGCTNACCGFATRAWLGWGLSTVECNGLDFSKSVMDSAAEPPKTAHKFMPINVIDNANYSALHRAALSSSLATAPCRRIRTDIGRLATTRQTHHHHRRVPEVLLFNVTADPNERHDLAAQYPKLVQTGKDILTSIVTGTDYQEPQTNQIHPRALPIFHHGVWAPFME